MVRDQNRKARDRVLTDTIGCMILEAGACLTAEVTVLLIPILHQAQGQVILLTVLIIMLPELLLPVLAILEEITTLIQAILMELPAIMEQLLHITPLIHLQAQSRVQDLNLSQRVSVLAGIIG